MSRRTVWIVVMVFCVLFWGLVSTVAMACDASRYTAYLTQGVMAGEQCQQFIRQFGKEMWTGEACEAMKDQLHRAKREQNRLLSSRCETFSGMPDSEMSHRKMWLAQHLADVGHTDLRRDGRKASPWILSGDEAAQ